MTPLITALIGGAVVLAGALVARSATRYAADLGAAARRRDAEIAHLAEFREALIGALTLFATYKHVLGRTSNETPKPVVYESAVTALEDTGGFSQFRFDTVLQIERIRILALGLKWEKLRSAFRPVDALLSPRDDLLGTAINVDRNFELIESFVKLVADHQRALIETYPHGRAGPTPRTPFI